jgi:hypothetical protein
LGLSEQAFRWVIVLPAALGVIMLMGMIINIKIAEDLKKANKLFFVLLIAIAIG